MRRLAVLGTAVAVSCALVVAAQSPSQAPLETFRAGVDVVQMDVSVLDKERRPVRGLTVEDFTVLENGTPQTIVGFDAVNIPDAEAVTAPWMRDAPVDVVASDRAARRVIVIVLDDMNTPLDRTRTAQHIARDVVDLLGPADLAAVTVSNYGKRQNITYDHERLLKAIDAFIPHPKDVLSCRYRGKYRSLQACVVDTLVTAADALRNAPAGRKTLVYIGGGPPFTFTMSDGTGGEDVPWGEDMLAIRAMFDSLRLANVNVYTFDPSGVTAEGIMGPRFDSLRMFAEDTGGRATSFTNAPWQDVPQVFRENSSYYMLGFRSSNTTADGAFRKVQIKVNRPDVEVRNRSGYFAPDTRARERPGRTLDPIEAAIGQSLPGGDLRLAAAVAPFAIAGQKNAAVAIATLLRDPLSAETQTVEIATMALDSDCGDCRKLPSTREVVRITPRSTAVSAPPEILSRLTLAPGSYEIRVAAAAEGRTGAVLAHLDVPDFRKARLAVSGLVVTAATGAATAESQAFADLVPVVPSTLREFGRGTSPEAFMRVYQYGSKAPSPALITATILDASNMTRLDETATIDAASFGAGKSFDYRIRLPIDRLDPGAYLLSVEARVEKHMARRQMRFWVK